MTAITLGSRVADRINGFNGLVTGRLEYLNGCRQFLVKPEKLDKDGKVQDGIWIDEQYLVFEVQLMADPFAASAEPTRGGPDRAERDLPR
jgi:hypothetical protein